MISIEISKYISTGMIITNRLAGMHPKVRSGLDAIPHLAYVTYNEATPAGEGNFSSDELDLSALHLD
jgi:hypothetical protein